MILRRSYKPTILAPALLALLLLSFLPPDGAGTGGPDPRVSEWENWRVERDRRLRLPGSFANLAGLFWLEQGRNTFGSSPGNDHVFPEFLPAEAGTLIWRDSLVVLVTDRDAGILADGLPADSLVVYNTNPGQAAEMSWGSYRWNIIDRAGNLGVRLRNLEHPLTKQPLNIPCYDWSEAWVVRAEYRPFAEPETLRIDNIVGFSFDEVVNGELVFERDGQPHALWPLETGSGFFLLFSDATSGLETYGAGRYLTAAYPDSLGFVALDFNRAYNPPCAFTEFATCPLPPAQNDLPLAVTAGEKNPH